MRTPHEEGDDEHEDADAWLMRAIAFISSMARIRRIPNDQACVAIKVLSQSVRTYFEYLADQNAWRERCPSCGIPEALPGVRVCPSCGGDR